MREIVIHNQQETIDFGMKLAEELNPQDVIALVGDLGTGKTTLTKAIAKGLGIDEPITSPTFTIVKEYESGRLPLYHFDVYRLEDSADTFEIGLEEYFYGKGVCIIEWADIIADALPDHTKCIFLEYGEKEGERIYRCTF